jgi:hypothetical protein
LTVMLAVGCGLRGLRWRLEVCGGGNAGNRHNLFSDGLILINRELVWLTKA